MSWVAIGAAVAGAVVSAGVGAGVSAASAPGPGFVGQPPPNEPIDINKLGGEVFNRNVLGYDMADADLAKRFPGLVTGQKQQISDAYKQLTGPLDPKAQNTFATRAIENSLGSTGGGNSMASLGDVGSAARNQTGVGMANQVMQKQDYDRSNFLNLLDSPLSAPRYATLGPEDAVNLSLMNTQNLNSYNQAKYSAKIQQQNADNQGGGG